MVSMRPDECPECGSKTRVYKSIPGEEGIARYRGCTRCDVRFQTLEVAGINKGLVRMMRDPGGHLTRFLGLSGEAQEAALNVTESMVAFMRQGLEVKRKWAKALLN